MEVSAKKKTRIFLAGFMGSGKSTIGPILANTLGYDFTDLDALIERNQKKRIGDIFKEEGEPRFRDIEREALHEVAQAPRFVISLGGGTITDQSVVDFVKGAGVLIYLKADTEYIYHRLRSKADRPMLRDSRGLLLDEEQLRRRIQELLAERERYYNQAHIIIHTDDKRIGNTVDELVKQLRKFIEE